MAEAVLASGLVYLCAWGRGCGLVHDWFDDTIAYQLVTGEREEETMDSVVVTTWHDDESLEEAAEYFLHYAVPAERYAGCDLWLAAAVGNPEWAARLRATLT